MIDLSYQIFTIECPNCQFSLDVLCKQMMAEEIVICPGCLSEIQLVDDGSSLKHAQQEIDEAIEDLMRNLRF